MPGGRGSDSVGRSASDASRGSSHSDNDSDKGSSRGSSRSGRRGGFGSIGDHQSYGMDRESFGNSIGRDRDHDRGSDHDKPAPKAEKPSESVVDSISDWAGDKWQGMKDYFGGKEDTGGFSPMGGPSSYGMSTKQFDNTIGKRRNESRSLGQRLAREIDYFSEAPMDYVSDLLDNPLVNVGMMASGLGMTAFGIKAVDATMDYFQGEATGIQSAKSIAGSAISSTPVGAALGPARQIAAAAVKSPEAFGEAVAGKIGAKTGGLVSSKIASAVTDNPYAQVAMTAAGAVGAGKFASNWAGEKMKEAKQLGTSPSPTSPRGPIDSGREQPSSPLVSQGNQAVAASKSLMQAPQVDLYAQTVKQLPFYGLSNNQQPFYGA